MPSVVAALTIVLLLRARDAQWQVHIGRAGPVLRKGVTAAFRLVGAGFACGLSSHSAAKQRDAVSGSKSNFDSGYSRIIVLVSTAASIVQLE